MASIVSFNIESVKKHLNQELVDLLPYVIDPLSDKVNESILKFVNLAAENENLSPDIYYMIAGQALETKLDGRKGMLSVCVDNDEQLKNVYLPTLIVWGEKDKHILITYCDYIKSLISHADVIKIPNCGHSLQFEKHIEFNKKLKDFCLKIYN